MTDLVSALTRVRDALDEVALPLELPGATHLRDVRRELVDQIDDYVVPRLGRLDAPLLAVVGGSTGAGKSTLVNSLVRQRVSEPGVLRPTTRSPVLVHHPDDADWFAGERVLPELARTTGASDRTGSLHLVTTDAVPAGLAILDAPDIDSVERSNRTLAAQLLAAADLWLFVTSAARYADQVPWDFLKAAAERSAAVAVVLDRTPPAAMQEVGRDLARMLTARGLKDSPLFIVTEGQVDEHGLLAADQVATIRGWLEMLAADAEARATVVRQTLEGAVRNISRRSHELADAHAQQVLAVERLRADADRAFADAARDVAEASADGTLLRGEVLARWQEFVGTGEFMRAVESKVSRVRDRMTGWAKGRPEQVEQVAVAVESGLETLILESAESAAEQAHRSWSSVEEGRRLLQGAGLGRASRDFRSRAERAVRDWQAGVLDLVRSEGSDKRSTARFLAFGVNGLSIALMVVVFSSTGGVTGAEVGIAGGSAVLGQKLLEAVFGDQAVRRLAERARDDLHVRVTELLEAERLRFTDLLDALQVDPTLEQRLRDATHEIDDERSVRRRRKGHAR